MDQSWWQGRKIAVENGSDPSDRQQAAAYRPRDTRPHGAQAWHHAAPVVSRVARYARKEAARLHHGGAAEGRGARAPLAHLAGPAGARHRPQGRRRRCGEGGLHRNRADTVYTCATLPTSAQRAIPFHRHLDMRHGPGLKP